MAQSTTLQLLGQTAYNAGTPNPVVRGVKQPAAAYYLGNADLQTVTWSLSNVTGTNIIQATLLTEPNEATDSDWFTVYLNSVEALSQNGYTNITGNYVWLRAKLNDFSGGVVQNIKVSY